MAPLADVPSVSSLPHDLLQLPVPVALTGPTSARHRSKRTARFAGLKVHWARFIKRVGADSPSDSSAVADTLEGNHVRTGHRTGDDADDDDDEVDEIVVDRDWSEDLRSSLNQSSERGHSRSSDSHAQIGASLSRGTTALPDDTHFLSSLHWSFRWEVWPAIVKFFSVRFLDDRTEERFHKEHWFIKKVSLSFYPLQTVHSVASSPWYYGPRFFLSLTGSLALPLSPAQSISLTKCGYGVSVDPFTRPDGADVELAHPCLDFPFTCACCA